MDFKNKLKTRLYLAICYILSGITLTIVFNVMDNPNEYLSTYGLVLTVLGIARLVRYLRITKTEETVKKQQILETDERNVAIVNKAKAMTFNVFVILLSITIIVLQFLNFEAYVQMLFYVLCAVLVIYWISYFIIRARS